MDKSITQATQNDKQISKSIKRFFTRFHVCTALYQICVTAWYSECIYIFSLDRFTQIAYTVLIE